MGVADIIGVDASAGTGDSNDEEETATRGYDPDKSKQFYGLFSAINVGLGIFSLIWGWNIDADNATVNTMEALFRFTGIGLLFFYVPVGINWLLLVTRNKDSSPGTSIFKSFYLLSYFTFGAPMVSWFGTETLYLLAYTQGNSSGLVVTNTA